MPNRDIGGNDSVPRMLRFAFAAAKQGNEEKAWSYWRSAINRGYVVRAPTERQLRLTIEKAKRDALANVRDASRGTESGTE